MLEFTHSERRVIIILTVILLGSAGWQYVRNAPVERPSIDYHKSDSIFSRRSHQAHPIQITNPPKNLVETASLRYETKTDNDKTLQIHLNINTASAEDLILLPRIGPSMARRIISYREQNGPFKSIDELLKVKGIGVKTLARIKPYLQEFN